MAGEFGGRADKFGNEFERRWVVSLALRILHGELRSLRWEPLAPEGRGIDVQVIRGDTSRAAYQCKWKNGTDGKWPLSRLRAEGVLTAIKEQIDQRAARAFVFVSRDPSPVLDELARRARGCNRDARAFRDALVTNNELPRSFHELCRDWALDPDSVRDVGVAVDTLCRLEFAPGYDGAQRRDVDLLAGRFVAGSGATTVAVLGAFLSDRLGNDVHADELRAALRETGLPPLDLEGDPAVAGSIEQLQHRFEDALAPYLISSSVLPRQEAVRILDLLTNPDGPRLILLHGPAGGGKSGVLLETVRNLISKGVPTLPIRLDAPAPRGATVVFARDVLGLPASPAHCLAALAGERQSVLEEPVRVTGDEDGECGRIAHEGLRQPSLAARRCVVSLVWACRRVA